MNLLIFLVLTVSCSSRSARRTTSTTTTVGALEQVRRRRRTPPRGEGQHVPHGRANARPRYAALQPGDQLRVDQRHAGDQLGPAHAAHPPAAGKTAAPWSSTARAGRHAAHHAGRATATTSTTRTTKIDDRRLHRLRADEPATTTRRWRSPGCPARSAARSTLGVDALGQYPQKIASLWRHRVRGQAARPERRRRRGRHRPHLRRLRAQRPADRPRTRCSRCSACSPASTCCCSSSTCCRCCRSTAGTSPVRWSRRPSAAGPGCARAGRRAAADRVRRATAGRCRRARRSSSTPPDAAGDVRRRVGAGAAHVARRSTPTSSSPSTRSGG